MNCNICNKPALFLCSLCNPAKNFCLRDKQVHVKKTSHILTAIKQEESKIPQNSKTQGKVRQKSLPQTGKIKAQRPVEERKSPLKPVQVTGNQIQDSLNFNSLTQDEKKSCIQGSFAEWRIHGIFHDALVSADGRIVCICNY